MFFDRCDRELPIARIWRLDVTAREGEVSLAVAGDYRAPGRFLELFPPPFRHIRLGERLFVKRRENRNFLPVAVAFSPDLPGFACPPLLRVVGLHDDGVVMVKALSPGFYSLDQPRQV